MDPKCKFNHPSEDRYSLHVNQSTIDHWIGHFMWLKHTCESLYTDNIPPYQSVYTSVFTF